MVNFSRDEMNLMCIYNTGTLDRLIKELEEMRLHLEADEKELCTLTDVTLAKLRTITEEEYSKLDLYPDFDIESI